MMLRNGRGAEALGCCLRWASSSSTGTTTTTSSSHHHHRPRHPRRWSPGEFPGAGSADAAFASTAATAAALPLDATRSVEEVCRALRTRFGGHGDGNRMEKRRAAAAAVYALAADGTAGTHPRVYETALRIVGGGGGWPDRVLVRALFSELEGRGGRPSGACFSLGLRAMLGSRVDEEGFEGVWAACVRMGLEPKREQYHYYLRLLAATCRFPQAAEVHKMFGAAWRGGAAGTAALLRACPSEAFAWARFEEVEARERGADGGSGGGSALARSCPEVFDALLRPRGDEARWRHAAAWRWDAGFLDAEWRRGAEAARRATVRALGACVRHGVPPGQGTFSRVASRYQRSRDPDAVLDTVAAFVEGGLGGGGGGSGVRGVAMTTEVYAAAVNALGHAARAADDAASRAGVLLYSHAVTSGFGADMYLTRAALRLHAATGDAVKAAALVGGGGHAVRAGGVDAGTAQALLREAKARLPLPRVRAAVPGPVFGGGGGDDAAVAASWATAAVVRFPDAADRRLGEEIGAEAGGRRQEEEGGGGGAALLGDIASAFKTLEKRSEKARGVAHY